MFQRSLGSENELRLLLPADSAALFSLTDQNRAYLKKWLPWLEGIRAEGDTLRFIQDSLAQYERRAAMQAGIWLRGQLAGVVGFQKLDSRNRKAAMGYWLGEVFQGQGIMTRACRGMVDHAFLDLGLNRVSIRCPSPNLRARKVAERLGFKHEGDLQEAEWFYDHFRDNVLYGVLARDWKRT